MGLVWWLNLVERWFREITDKAIRRGAFASVEQLIDTIDNYIAHNNDHPRPFIPAFRTSRNQYLAIFGPRLAWSSRSIVSLTSLPRDQFGKFYVQPLTTVA